MDKVVVGGTSGINRGIARNFAVHSAKVAVASRDKDKVDDTLTKLSVLTNRQKDSVRTSANRMPWNPVCG